VSSSYRIYFLPEDLRSYSEWIASARDLLKRNNNTRDAIQESGVRTPKGPLASIAIPSLLRARLSTASTDARTRLARLAVAATAYQLENKKYPATLDDLVPDFIAAVPVDPFDQKPLKMTTADGGLVLYSVGGDGIDGGGVEEHRGMVAWRPHVLPGTGICRPRPGESIEGGLERGPGGPGGDEGPGVRAGEGARRLGLTPDRASRGAGRGTSPARGGAGSGHGRWG